MSIIFVTFFACILNLLQATATTKTFIYKEIGALALDALVIYPDLPSGQLSPVLFAIHPGAFMFLSNKIVLTSQEQNEALSRGWTIVSINYRLAPAVLLEDIMEDVQDAYHWIRTNLSQVIPINPDLITIFGASSGGGLALISGYRLTPRPKAIVVFYPYLTNYHDRFVCDLSTPPSKELIDGIKKLSKQSLSWYHFESSHLKDLRWTTFEKMCWEKKVGWAMVLGDLDESEESIIKKLQAVSVVDNVDKDYPPTYLSHGLVDEVVLFTQSVQLAKKLEENNVEFVLDLVDNAMHSFDVLNTSEEIWEEHVLPAFDFITKFMK